MLFKELCELLESRQFISVATCNFEGVPNAAPKFLMKVENQSIYMIDYTVGMTWENLKINPRVSLSVSDAETFKCYKIDGTVEIIEEGDKAWTDWKRAQVTEFLSMLAVRTRTLQPEIQISATGCAPFVRSYQEAFQDWPGWLHKGIVDFVILMSYTSNTDEFKRYIGEAKDKCQDFKKINIAFLTF